VLTTTNLGPPGQHGKPVKKPAADSGPRIHLSAVDSAAGTGEVWKWVGLALLFGGGGVLATLAVPLLRQLRLF